MGSIDDLPIRHATHDIQDKAEQAFDAATAAGELFLIQRADRKDYGTDVQIEAKIGTGMSNVRTHIQLKGTEKDSNKDDSVSVAVPRKNLNYLLNQRDALYVCYHLPTKRLLYRYAISVFRVYEHSNKDWQDQDEITIRFSEEFNIDFQTQLFERVTSKGRSDRDNRLVWSIISPRTTPALLKRTPQRIEVPEEPEAASEMLTTLYESGYDLEISAAFDEFKAMLGNVPNAMDVAYMSEINIGINGQAINDERVRYAATEILGVERGIIEPGTRLYCQGNAWSVLGETDKAKESYFNAMPLLQRPDLLRCAAMCAKNWGSLIVDEDQDNQNNLDTARSLYELAVKLDPDLDEAHFALGTWHVRFGNAPQLALDYFDRVLVRECSNINTAELQGWRIQPLFRLGDVAGAFRELNSLLASGRHLEWPFPWCARQVSRFGGISIDGCRKAEKFWNRYLNEYKDEIRARRELFLCQARLEIHGERTGIDFKEAKSLIQNWVGEDDSDTGWLWDRLGHVAQALGLWDEAAAQFEKAYAEDPSS